MQPVFPSFRVFPDMLTHAMLSLAAYACRLLVTMWGHKRSFT